MNFKIIFEKKKQKLTQRKIEKSFPGWGLNPRPPAWNASALSPRLFSQLIQEPPPTLYLQSLGYFKRDFHQEAVHCGSRDQVGFLPTGVYFHTALRNPRSSEVLEIQPFYYLLYYRAFPEKMLPKEYCSSQPNSFLPSDRQTTQVYYAKIFLKLEITSTF